MYYSNASKFRLALIGFAGERSWTWNVPKLTQHRHGVLGELEEPNKWTWNVLKLTQNESRQMRRTNEMDLERP